MQRPHKEVKSFKCGNPQLIYAYCIIDSSEQLNGSISGLEGASVYNIPYNDIGIVSSDLSGKVVTDENTVMTHEKVIETLMEKYTVLPMRFHTVFRKEENVILMMQRLYDEFQINLQRLCGKVEIGLKVLWNGKEVKARIIEGMNGDGSIRQTNGASPGRNLLEEKLIEYRVDNAFNQEADRSIEGINNMLNGYIADRSYKRLQTENLLLDAAYLVEKERIAHFREIFGKIQAKYCDFRYLLSGPWPPFSFVNIEKQNIKGERG